MEDGIFDPSQMETTFNLEDEYKPDPLAPVGTYFGNTTNAGFNPEQQCIVFNIVAQGNEGVLLSDGETPIDGAMFFARVWLPRTGDENVMSKNGRSTKRQVKINMMKQFSEKMEISMDTAEEIAEALSEGSWIGIPVIFSLTIDEYEGRVRNSVGSVSRNRMDEEEEEPSEIAETF